jgi:acyl transferase domain-containing protein/acyl-CoA synthetase (AMP-forming)/AMP-acid ligase II/NADPH:quinone reductase-like Zn-dependent oxidoreductase/acyl carrier protein
MSQHQTVPPSAATLGDVLRWRAAHQPDQAAYTFLSQSESSIAVTYGELDRRARALGARLQQLGAGGERALLLLSPGIEYITALFGCLYADVTAVPAYSPRPGRPDRRIEAITQDAQARLALTTRSRALDPQKAPATTSPGVAALHWVMVDGVDDAEAHDWREQSPHPDGLALLQYTSGSTAAPKGVMVRHSNLIHNVAILQRALELTPQDRGVSWLPLYHDMGLISAIWQPLYTGFPVTLLSPVDFLQHPFRWLQAITRTRATLSGGPDFAYDLCARRVTPAQRALLDLSSWQVAFSAAEPIRSQTIDRFMAAFAPHGFRRQAFYPSYGLAEATLFVTGGARAEAPIIRTSAQEHPQVGSGCGWPGQTLLIVDPETRVEQPPGQVGEIWLASPGVAQGYWGRPQETAETFGARLANSDAGPFLRTGDLGLLEAGQLFVSGRLKDVIIIRGTNHYPQDIELTASSSHPTLRPNHAAAFMLDRGDTQQLVILHELDRRQRHGDAAEVARAIQQAVAEQHDLQIDVIVLLEPGAIPRTSSGKIERYRCRELFLAGDLESLYTWARPAEAEHSVPSDTDRAGGGPSAEAIQAWLVGQIARQLGIPAGRIDVREPFASYGLDSLTAVGISGELEAWLGRQLSPTLAWEHPSIAALARYLADVPQSAPRRAAPMATRRAPAEPIAIIGIACRFPGAPSPDAFWRLLCDGGDAIAEVPPDRWDVREYYDPDPARPGKMTTRWGGFLEHVDQFDARFFGIAPREAVRMDPQQRILLELAWEVLEDAGQSPDQLAESPTGVFVGMLSNDYGGFQADPAFADMYVGTGNASSIASNRISYALNLRGPSMTVDTACSSSLVALHLACTSIWNGETELALAGGVNLLLMPTITVSFSKAGMMAPDGRCKAFDAQANGYVRSDGAGMVALKPLAAALADGDPIYAVIRGSAVNQDGRSNGLTAPNPEAQTAVIREACQRAGVEPGQIIYIEAHGTGTALGDPIEAQALGQALALGRPAGRRHLIGSVKTNIGHTEGAAGIAGIIKAALALKHRTIPPSLHFRQPSPYIPFDGLALEVVRSLTPWPAGPALAGVNSFGFGGTNAHVVLEAAPATAMRTPAPPAGQTQLIPLSARSPEALRALAQAYRAYAEQLAPDAALRDIGYSASVRRSHHDHRLALVARSPAELIEQLDAFLAGQPQAGVAAGKRRGDHRPRLVFVFSGQGSQIWGMGRALFEQEPVFRIVIEKCDELVKQCGGWSLIEELLVDEAGSRLAETAVAQPMIFALQVALAALWRSWGIVPDAVVGHSVGEVAAAHIAGALRLEDAVRVLAQRGRLMQQAEGRGRMAAVELPAADVEQILASYCGRLTIAAINSPASTVISGDADALEDVLQSLAQRGVYQHMLPVNYAFHSAQMDPFCAPLAAALAGLRPRPARIPIISTAIEQPGDACVFDAAYWVRNMREPVRFAAAIDRLARDGYDIFLEISAQPVLASAIVQSLANHSAADAAPALVLASLRRTEATRVALLRAVGELYCYGYPLDWRRFYPDGAQFVRLPHYPWQRERYWLDSAAAWARPGQAGQHPLLGRRLPSAHPAWQSEIDVRRLAYLDDHRIQGSVLLPGTAYTEIALAAATAVFGNRPHTLTDLELRAPLFLSGERACTLQVICFPDADNPSATPLHIYSRSESAGDSWTLHMRVLVQQGRRPARAVEPIVPEQLRARALEEVSGRALYSQLQDKGFEYGPSFQGITRLWRGDGEAWGLIEVAPELAAELDQYHFHPAVMDACGQVMLALTGPSDETFVPVTADLVAVAAPPQLRMWSYVRLRTPAESRADFIEGDGYLIDEAGQLLAELTGLRLQRATYGAQHAPAQDSSDWLYTITWQPQPLPEQTARAAQAGSWLIFADRGGVGAALAARLAERQAPYTLAFAGDGFMRLDDGWFQVDGTQPDTMQQLLGAVADMGGPAVRGIVYLWGLDAPHLDAIPADEATRAALPACVGVLHLVQALSQAGWEVLPRLWLITRGAQAVGDQTGAIAVAQTTLWGLGRSILYEHPEYRCTNIDLGPCAALEEQELLFGDIWSDALPENQVALRGATRLVARLARYAPRALPESAPQESRRKEGPLDQHLAITPGQPFRVNIATPGSLDNLIAQPAARRAPGPDEVEIQVRAAGLNFRDVLKTLGMYPTNGEEPIWLGDECAGRVVAVGSAVEGVHVGDEVIAVAPACFGTYATTRAAFVVPRPDDLEAASAATIPVAFLTAYYALHHLARLARGERVLIHAASGGVGLAAIQVAQSLGAEIFATAGSPQKRELLRSLGVPYVMDSRTLDFAGQVLEYTDGRGVDVVLNSLTGEAMRQSLALLCPYGRFLEIGKRDIYQNNKLGLRPFKNDLTFFSIDMARLFRDRPNLAGELLREIMAHIGQKVFRALPAQVFPIAEATAALRHMAQAQHHGKIVLALPPDMPTDGEPAAPAHLLRADRTYLITGGLGGLGLLVAQWMVEQGARRLVLMGRSAPAPAVAEVLERLRLAGAQITIARADVSEAAQLANVLADSARALPPLGGIMHAAGVMDNDVLLQLDRQRFEAALRPKIAGAWNLHQQTLGMPLDFFVLFSSAASLLGSPRQGNYAAANAALDGLAQHRRLRGLPVLSINWGPWLGLGMAAHFDRDRRLAMRGIGSIPAQAGLDILELLLRQALGGERLAEVGVMPIVWPRWRGFYPAVDHFPMFSAFVQADRQQPGGGAGRARAELLASAPEARPAWLEAYMQQQIARVMRLAAQQIDLHQPLNTIGMDSLMGIELKNRVEADLGIVFPIGILLQGPSIAQVAAELLKLVQSS